ncbi:MAG: hypothetical protein JKY67_04100 [Pseudomonadales bacterium]|nr:hypothetical protein [Pseudomonadales bacterium]
MQIFNTGIRFRSQVGIGLIIMFMVLVLTILSLAVAKISVNKLTSFKQSSDADSLAVAKDALIAYALVQARAGNNYSPRLPCPDINLPGTAGYGVADSASCGTSSTISIGYLPWQTLGISEQVDSDSVPIWYVLAGSFKNLSGTNPALNTDTLGGLTTQGYTDDVVAYVVAPHAIVSSQTRPNVTTSNYLEGENADGDSVFLQAIKSDTFNDTILSIRQDEITELLEDNDIGPDILTIVGDALTVYFTDNNYYPFTAAINSTNGNCMNNRTAGLLPVNLGACTGVDFSDYLPTWFEDNEWWKMIYYEVDSECAGPDSDCDAATLSITLDAGTAQQLILAYAGRSLSGQARGATANDDDFLEDPDTSTALINENTNGDSAYEVPSAAANSNDAFLVITNATTPGGGDGKDGNDNKGKGKS